MKQLTTDGKELKIVKQLTEKLRKKCDEIKQIESLLSEKISQLTGLHLRCHEIPGDGLMVSFDNLEYEGTMSVDLVFIEDLIYAIKKKDVLAIDEFESLMSG